MKMSTKISHNIYVKNASPAVVNWAYTELVVTNPKYEQLVRLGKEEQVRRYHISPKMFLYAENGFDLILPFGCLRGVWQFIKDEPVELCFNQVKDINCKYDRITQPLFDYQEEAVKKMVQAKGGILIGGCGSGKTNCGIEIIKRIGKNALWLCHTKDLLTQTVKRIKSLYPNMHVGTITDGKVDMVQDGITVSTIQTLVNIEPDLYVDKFGTVLTDECFPAGTKVSTPYGYKNIEDIKVGDTVLSYNHKTNSVENKTVKHLFVNTSNNLHKLILNDKIIIATGNHPFYTKRGYIPLEDLKNGDYVLCKLWKSNPQDRSEQFKMEPCQEKGKDILFKGMCFEEKEETYLDTRKKGKDVSFNDTKELDPSFYEKEISRNGLEQSYEQLQNKRENVEYKGKKWNPTLADKKSGWKWENCTLSTNVIQLLNKRRGKCCLGVCRSDSQKKRRKTHISALLQDRYCFTREENSNRGRWRIPSGGKSETKGYEENYFFEWIRVEGVQSFKQSGTEEPTGSLVYNFEVEDNNNYFVEDILVHNCHHVSGSPTLQKYFVKVVSKIPARYKYGITASEKRNDSLTKSMYTTLGCNLEGEFEPTWKIDRRETRTLTARHEKVELDTPFSYCFLESDGTFSYSKLVDYIATHEKRNETICDKIVELCEEGRKQLVLCSRITQCEELHKQLTEKGAKSVLLVGKVSAKKREAILTEKTDWNVIVATVSLAKEGLDVVSLDTLHLASCLGNESDTVQSVGRIERVCEGKKEPIVFDYVDINIPYLTSRYKKRVNWLRRRK